jgi:hypothetical protein
MPGTLRITLQDGLGVLNVWLPIFWFKTPAPGMYTTIGANISPSSGAFISKPIPPSLPFMYHVPFCNTDGKESDIFCPLREAEAETCGMTVGHRLRVAEAATNGFIIGGCCSCGVSHGGGGGVRRTVVG